MEPDPLYFSKCYYLLNSSKIYYPTFKKAQICRYCGKSVPEVTFKQVTHLIPELLGENNIHTFDECDKCNLLFSGYESHLAIFFRPYITMLGIKGKTSIPPFQSRSIDRKENTRTILIHNQGKINLEINKVDDYNLNEVAKTFDIIFRKPNFVPVKIYKALVKIGLSLLPQESDPAHKETFEWLQASTNELSYINQMFTTTLVRKYFAQPVAELYHTTRFHDKSREWPDYTLVVFFANQVVQIFMPFSQELLKVHSKSRTLEVNLFTDHFRYDNKLPQIFSWDIGINHSVTQDHRIHFSYQGIERNVGGIDGKSCEL